MAERDPGVVKKPYVSLQRPDSQHQLTLLTHVDIVGLPAFLSQSLCRKGGGRPILHSEPHLPPTRRFTDIAESDIEKRTSFIGHGWTTL